MFIYFIRLPSRPERRMPASQAAYRPPVSLSTGQSRERFRLRQAR